MVAYLKKNPACLLFLKNLSNIAGVITQMAWLKRNLLHRALQFNFDRITGLVDKGDRVDVIHLLISKLSDTVPHDILIIKLRKYGLEVDKITMRWREQLAEKLLSRSSYQWFTVKVGGSFRWDSSGICPCSSSVQYFHNDSVKGKRDYIYKICNVEELGWWEPLGGLDQNLKRY